MSNSKYLDDKSVNESYHDEGFVNPKNVMIGSAMIAGSVLAYKGGAFKPLIKEAIELSGQHKPTLSLVFNDMRKWIKSNEGVNENSLFRQDMKSLVGKIVKQDKDVAKDIINATREDLDLYKRRLDMSIDAWHEGTDRIEVLNNYSNTEMLNQMKRGSYEVSKYSDVYSKQKATMKSKIYDTILGDFTRTDEQMAEQIKRTGYRPASVEDLFESSIDKDGYIRLKEKTKYDFSKKGKGDYKSPVENLENMLNFHIASNDGSAMFKDGNIARLKDKHNLKNIVLDDALLIGKDNKIVDLRTRRRETLESIRNLSNEWKVPFINVNPLQMVGLGKVGRPKINFGTIKEDMVAPVLTGRYGNTVENTIANVKKTDDKLKDVIDGVTIINGDVYTLGKESGIKKIDYKYKKKLTMVSKSQAHNTASLTHAENSQRKMMGISQKHYEDYTKADGDKYVKQQISKFFDIGRQEKDASKGAFETVLEGSNPDGYVENLISKLTRRVKPYKDTTEFGNFTEMMRPGRKSMQEDTFLVTNKSITLKDLKVNKFNKDMTMDYAKQYIANFKKDSELVNNKTGVAHFIVERMNQAISSVGLGTSLESNTGPVASAMALITKRFLPVYGAYQGWNALNAITEGEDENGQRTNLNRSIMEGVSTFDVGVSKIRDTLGITKFSKKAVQLMPGYDQIEELPGIKNLNLDQSAEERQDYWEYGKDAVRKSRYWALNSSTSFTGGKVSYFKMNPLMAAKADARYSDSQFGSRREYFANILNPYHYDEKHYKDRPYLMTSPAFENVPIFGDTLSATVGKFVKPQVKMHQEYWNEDGSVKTSNQIKGEELIANIQQQRMVSQGVASVMKQDAGQTLQDVYTNTFADNIKAYTEMAKQKAMDIVKNTERGAQKVVNLFSELFPSTMPEIPQYDTNINTERAMLNATEEYSHAIDRKRNRNRVDDSAYYNDVENTSINTMYKEGFRKLLDTQKSMGDARMYRELDDIYFATVRPFQAKTDYTNNQMPISADSVPMSQEIGGNMMVLSQPQYGAYGTENSIGNNYQEASRSILQSQSGSLLGGKKDFGKMIEFDKGYDLSNQSMVYRTGSGKYNVINTGEEIDPLSKVNLNGESPQSFIGNSKRYSVTDNYLINKDDIKNIKEQNIQNPNGLVTTIQKQVADTSNVAGIYGFAFNSFVTGDTQKGTTVIETSGYSRSFNKMFWDQELGGFGGDISEIFRRLVQKRQENGVDYYNPIRNTMPDWLPGEDGFIDFQHGDPYSKIARGEERLPGEGFERAYGIDVGKFSVGSSAMGKSKEELIAKFLEKDDITEEWQQDIVRKGTAIHEKVEEYMVRNYVAIDTEQKIYDKEKDIVGFYDAKIHDTTARSGERIVDIKTISSKGFDNVVKTGMAKEEHIKQVNWYLHHDNQDSKGGILYVDRENPTRMHMVGFDYSKRLYDESISNVEYARNEVRKALDSGQISRAERYRPMDKLRILADVAPYSQEYNDMLKYVRSIDMDEEQKKQVQQIEDMVSEQRKPLRTYEYRFKTADVVSKKVDITRQIDDDKFMTDGYENPIKLAGIYLPSKTKDEEKHKKAMEFLEKNVKGKVEVKVAKDEHVRTNKDSMKTMNAVVYANGMNINRELIKRGLADEKEKDYSAAGVHARFNSLQRNFGSAWETIAHQNTIINDKVLRVRSAKEDYERQQVYGKDFKDWKHPVEDFLKPMLWRTMADETTTDRVVGAIGGGLAGSFFGGAFGTKGRMIGAVAGATAGGGMGTALAAGALVGSMFGGIGKGGSKFGRLLGAATGALTVAGAKSYKIGYEAATGEKWTPKEKRRENEVVEYLDKLEFIKNRRLYEAYSQKALKEDGIDVKKLIQESKEKGDKNKSWARKVENIKREQKKTGKFNTEEYEKIGLKFNENDKKKHTKRKDSANEKQIQDIDKRKEVIKKEKRKLFEAKGEIIKKNLEHMKDNNMMPMDKEGYSEESETVRKQKKKIKEKNKGLKKATKKYMEDSKNRKQTALEQTVNERIEKAKTSKEIMMTSPNAMKAIEYYNKAESTMYGYDPGEEISSFVKALPKKDRKYFNEFLKAGEKERKEIMEIAPKYMRRALQSSYGLKVDDKEDLIDYFDDHYLPDEDWDGWQESYDFNAIKTKVISKEGFNLASHDIWEDNKNMADMYGATPVPNMDHRTKDIQAVKRQLESVLGEAGYQDLDITVSKGASAPSINLDIYEDRKQEFESRIKERMRDNNGY